jgi:hypothetical protein
MSQTTWTEEEAVQQLEENDYNVIECVRKFMGISMKEKSRYTEDNKLTINQGIYKNIRTMMDEASIRYEKKKEVERKLQEIRESYQ